MVIIKGYFNPICGKVGCNNPAICCGYIGCLKVDSCEEHMNGLEFPGPMKLDNPDTWKRFEEIMEKKSCLP